MPGIWPRALVRWQSLGRAQRNRPISAAPYFRLRLTEHLSIHFFSLHPGPFLLHSCQSCTVLYQACQHDVMKLTVPVALSCRAKTLVAGYIITTIVDMILIVCVGAYQTGDAALDGGAFPFMQG